MSGRVSSVEGELNFIVKEYLDYMGLQNVSKLFEEECLLHNKPIQENFATYRSERMQKIQKELLCYFEEGRQAEFFAVWDSLIMRSRPAATAAPCGDLEFYLRLHFAIYPQRYPEKAKCQGNLTAEGAMANFRQYIESIKAHTEDPLVYFALPYVQNPRQFPVFKSIFEESWVEDLKSKVEKFVQDCLSTQYHQCSKPRLVDLYYCNDVELNDVRQDFRCCEQRLQETERHRAMQEKQVSKLQEDYKTLVTITAELLTALEATIRGDLVNLENVLASCGQRFPELVKLQTPQTSQASSLDDPQAFVLRSGLCTKRARLDFNKIKQDLSEVDASTRALLLQALRWKLTKASSVEERDCVLLAYVENDLLGFIERSPDYCNRILHLIKSPNSGLQQSFVRFLNAFAAFRSGRSYLARNLQLVAVLTDSLVSNHVINSRTGDMILGTLQKLSLRQQQKEIMINHGILEWIVRTLQESGEDEISDYGIEYITALFMNLCLQKSAKQRCSRMSSSVLSVMKKLLEHRNVEIIPYLNGALYSLFSDAELRKVAVSMGLESSLQKAKLHAVPDVGHQLDQVRARLLSSDSNGDGSAASPLEDDDDEESQEESEPEPELEMDDIVQALPHQMYGDQLLKIFYQEENQDTASQRGLTASSQLDESSLDQSLAETTANAGETSQSDEMGSTQTTHTTMAEFAAPPVDEQASELVKQITGEEKTLVAAAAATTPPSGEKVNGLNMQEYSIAFSSRPKIPRTPEPSSCGTSSSRVDSTPTSSRSLRRSPASTASRGNASAGRPLRSIEQE
ncbi:lisH domain-containing protein ARMC9-like [Haemaphysalis longicornis]